MLFLKIDEKQLGANTMKKMGGNRRKTRDLLSKQPRNRGKFSITNYFQTFKKGDVVLLKAEPAIHSGMYFRRFNAKRAIVTGKRGECYLVQIDDFGKKKLLIVHPVHLRRYQQ